MQTKTEMQRRIQLRGYQKRHTCFALVRFFKTRIRGDELTPTEMKYSCIWVSEVKQRYSVAFQVSRVYNSRFPEMRPLERRSIQRPKVLNHSQGITKIYFVEIIECSCIYVILLSKRY